MSYTFNVPQSNKSDFTLDLSVTDGDESSPNFGLPVDLTGAEVTLTISDECGGQLLTASIGNGITQPAINILEVLFGASQMESLYPGSYNIGCVYSLNGETNQILVGTVSVYDGVALI